MDGIPMPGRDAGGFIHGLHKSLGHGRPARRIDLPDSLQRKSRNFGEDREILARHPGLVVAGDIEG